MSYADRELAAAATKGNLSRVRFLVEKDGANVDYQDEFGWTALLHAVSEGHLEIVKYLLSKGAKTTTLSSDGANALHHAVASQNDTLLAFLLQYNTCDVNARNSGGTTPLHLACLTDQQSAVRLLLANKADKTIRNNEGKTAEDIATSPKLRSIISEYGNVPTSSVSQEELEGDLQSPRSMQQSLQKLQTLQNAPPPREMKEGYTYLLEDHGSNDDLLTVTTSTDYDEKSNNNNNNNSNSNNNNNNTLNNRKAKSRSNGAESDKEREFQEIFDSIQVLRGISPDKLNLLQMQELIDFHEAQLKKFTEAKKILEEIRAREMDLLLTS